MKLGEALVLKQREIISLVGGGGKTTLMFALAEELSSKQKGIILTTTTKIWDPSPSPSFARFWTRQFSEMKKWVSENWEDYPYLLVAAEKLANGKLQGVDPSWIPEFYSLPGISLVIVEADGAAGRPLKAPREGEPVLPPNTSLLIPVVGIDALGCPLEEEFVFRSEIASRILNLPLGSAVTNEAVSRLLEEMVKSRPPASRVIPFLNKVESKERLQAARALAKFLLSNGGGRYERIILGQARGNPVVKEIILHSRRE
jgi:probable selenium-dependent hydroxylase accessory protein YqeC